MKRKETIDAEPELIDFYESAVGVAHLHRLVMGAHFVMTLMGSCSVRHVCQFLEITGLDRFVAPSYGTQQKIGVKIETACNDFGREEKSRLAENMPVKEITTCQDETFHPETCLVAIEPVSNFILLEKYAESRKSSEWTKAMEEATKDLPVKIIQSTSDEGRGILCHVKNDLGAHHAPDLFHVQYEIAKGTSAALAAKTKKAEVAVENATKELARQVKKKSDYMNGPPRQGRPPEFDKRIEDAQRKEEEAKQNHDNKVSHQQRMKAAIQQISTDYHPVDLESGKLRDAETVSESLKQSFTEVESVATEANLGERSMAKIAKAKKVVIEMLATIAFFHFVVRAKVEALSLAPKVENAVLEKLIPAAYIELVAEKAQNVEDRKRFREKSKQILSSLQGGEKPFEGLDKDELETIEKVARECASLFQRSSSCVEGRNGQLSLRHHSLHRLSNRKIGALTVVHNYYTRRRDGTTAAERFFENKPKDLFEYLLAKVDLPGRPAKKRRPPKIRHPLLVAA